MIKNSGFIFLEIIISVTLIGVVFVTLLGIGFLMLNASSSIQKQTQADSLIKEGFEAVRNFRDGTTWATNGLGTVSVGSSNPYYLASSANQWVLTAGTETIGIFTRKIIFDAVSRDVSGNIENTYNESTKDTDTIKVTITVTWLDKTIQNVSYLTNWKND